MERSDEGARTLATTIAHWQSAILIAAVVAGGLILTVMVIGSVPIVNVQASQDVPGVADAASILAAEPVSTESSVPETTEVLSTADTTPLTVEESAALTQPATAAPAPAAPAQAPPADVAAPVAVPAPAAAGVVAPHAPAAAPAAAATPTPAKSPAPAAAPATTAAPAPAVAPTTAPPAASASYPTYRVSGSGLVSLQFDGSSIYVASVTPEANWVFDIEKNGPRSVEVKFFNVATEREGEFHAALEGGRIKVETGD